MKKLVTIVVLPYAKAHILKMRLEAKKITCELEDFHVIEGSTTSTVRVKIFENDIAKALPELDYLLGLKPEAPNKKEDLKRQILVPVDFSKVSEKAARLAFSISQHLNAELVIMHSYMSPVSFSIPYGDIYPFDSTLLLQSKDAEKKANKSFQEFISLVAQRVGKELWEAQKPEYIVKPGYASDDILAYAKEHKPQLLVLGRGGDKSWSGAVGSVTADIMYNAPIPVLVVPEEMHERPLSEYKEILYATNFDAKDFIAIDKLMGIVKPFKLKLTCAHVGEPDQYGWDLARLEGMKDILNNKYTSKEFECKLIMGKDVLQTLEQHLEQEEVDVLALTTHKRNMISRLFNPSLARKMVFHTHTPLLVFHA